MRVLAIVLVVLGCLGLGRYGFRSMAGSPDRAAASAAEVPPAVAGIAVVGGLLLLTTATRRSA